MSIEVCISLTGTLEREIAVNFFTANISLTSSNTDDNDIALADVDYQSLAISLTFVSNGTMCTTVQLFVDSSLENEEVFVALLTSNDTAVNISSPSAEIFIVDSSRKYFLLLMML